MANLNFKYGLWQNLGNADFNPGTIYVTTDEKALYVDLPNGSNKAEGRIRIGQTIVYDTTAEFINASNHPEFSPEGFYYIEEANMLLRWKGGSDAVAGATDTNGDKIPEFPPKTGWIQINSTSDVVADLEGVKAEVNQLKEDVSKAQETADDAVEAAATADGKAVAAQETADQAVEAAATADGKAVAAQETADQAVEDAKAAQETADQAVEDAATADGKAVAAQETADQAVTNAATAQAAAEAAQGTADTALANAATADGKAVAAQGRADDAYAKAEQGVSDAATAQARADSAYTLADGKTTMAEVEAKDYATKTQAKGYADAVLGAEGDDIDDKTVYGAFAAAAAAQTKAEQGVNDAAAALAEAQKKTTMADVEAKGYATKTEAEGYANAVLGTSGDAVGTATVYGALASANKGIGDAKTAQETANQGVSDAAKAQSRADDAYTLAGQKATLDEVKGLGYATVEYVDDEIEAVIGGETDAAGTVSVRGALASAAAAQTTANQGVSDAAKAQSKADEAHTLAGQKATLDEVKALNYATKTEAQGYASAVLGTSNDDAGATTVHGALKAAAAAQEKADQNAEDIADLAGLVGELPEGTKATTIVGYIDEQAEILDEKIDAEIRAVNAMDFKGTVEKFSNLPTTGVKIGDTYVLGNNDSPYTAGDLFVATGTEGDDGIISGDISWNWVKTGYQSAHDPKFFGKNNELVLENFSGEEIGSVTFTSVEKDSDAGVKVEVKDNNIAINLQWGQF